MKDIANLLVWPHIHIYPEDSNDDLYETWNAKKWCSDLNNDMLTPMAIGINEDYFYVDEIAMTHDNVFFIPQRWIILHNDLVAYSDLIAPILVCAEIIIFSIFSIFNNCEGKSICHCLKQIGHCSPDSDACKLPHFTGRTVSKCDNHYCWYGSVNSISIIAA